MRLLRSWRWTAVWALLTLAGAATMTWAMLDPAPSPMRAWFTPGPMTHGHHSIELACGACHTSAFGGAAALQESCIDCHGDALKAAEDSHPQSKFTDPRNADLVDRLDGRLCLSCHVEHRPQMTGDMGLTLPQDYCVTCHAKVGEERPTHAGLGFDTCASAGCHNYHDNRALYEDFLVQHVNEPAMLDAMRLPARDFAARWKLDHAGGPATVADAAAEHVAADPAVMAEWLASSHAAAGVQCSDCHAPKSAAWTDHPGREACAACHDGEVQGFLAGKHGMRLDVGLSPMTPAQALLPMRADAAAHALGCSSCHGAHRFDTAQAAVDGCLGCHADEHSLAYRDSKHFALWQAEVEGKGAPGSGVSCASCHLPRVVEEKFGQRATHVQHNQNDNLRPNEAMIRPVCMQCHGLGFAIDALADEALVARNFVGLPLTHLRSIEMAERNAAADQARRAAGGD